MPPPPHSYGALSGLANSHNDPSNLALGLCATNLLSEVRDRRFEEALDRLFNGERFLSEDDWELCRWPHRYLGVEIVTPYSGVGFLAWIDPDDHVFDPEWRTYEEGAFVQLPAGCVERHSASVVVGREFEAELIDALRKFIPGLRTVRATYSSKRLVASRSRSYRLVSGNGGNQDSRRTIQLS